MGEVRAFPDGALAAAPPPPRRAGFLVREGAADPLPAPNPAGTTTSSRLPFTSTMTLDRSDRLGRLGGGAGVRGDLVDELRLDPAGVDPELAPSAAMKAGSSSTARWNGTMPVSTPSMTSSAKASAGPWARAWSRSAPVTMILATNESKLSLPPDSWSSRST